MNGGGHIIMSAMEHNSVSRPVNAMKEKGIISYSIAKTYADDDMTVQSFRKLINSDTKAIVCTLASNVTGRIMPYKKIAELCRENNLCFIADGAQACGIIPIKMSDGINILCTAGHKGLYGITGTGLLISDGKYNIKPIMFGGTGSNSFNLAQPDFLPDSLESGTVNVIGASSVKAGIDFIQSKGIENIFKHESGLCEYFIRNCRNIDGIKIYRHDNLNYVPIVSFNLKDELPENVAAYLAKYNFCLRAGFHCASLAHNTLGTEIGTVRFAPSVFNSAAEVENISMLLKKY